MKVYKVLCGAKFKWTVDGKTYNPTRLFVGEVAQDGTLKSLKIVKAVDGFVVPSPSEKVYLFFDENGKAVSYEKIL